MARELFQRLLNNKDRKIESNMSTLKGEKKTSEPVSAAPEEIKTRLRIKIRAYDHKVIDQSVKKIIETAQRTGASIVGPIPLPTEKNRYTVNKSTFVHKNSREQYEIRTHKRLLDIVEPNAKTVEALTSLNLPTGVDIEIKM